MSEKPSKTQRKREMTALQDLGAELATLTEERLAAVELPDFLREALTEARRITGFEARRRQMQYVGKLMRQVDAAPIRAQLEAWKSPQRALVAQFKRAEAWRERLMREDGAMDDLLREHPAGDAQRLRLLVHEARGEQDEGRSPRRYRELFRALAALLEQGGD